MSAASTSDTTDPSKLGPTVDDMKINEKPVCILVLGMAGSGKTEFVKRLSTFKSDTVKPYTINLDPACRETPYQTNIGRMHLETEECH